MPNFEAAFTAGTTLEPWEDAATGSLPTRLNPIANRRHKRRVTQVHTEVEITATLDGVAGPLDATLGGLLFISWFAEHVAPYPVISSPAGQSSVRRFTPQSPGHYTFVIYREDSGGVIMHLDVEP